MTFMRPPPATQAQDVPGTPDDVLARAFERLSFLTATSSPVWDRELHWPPGSGDRLTAIAELLSRVRHTLHHPEVRGAIRAVLDAYEAWEVAQDRTDVRAVARPPPR